MKVRIVYATDAEYQMLVGQVSNAQCKITGRNVEIIKLHCRYKIKAY